MSKEDDSSLMRDLTDSTTAIVMEPPPAWCPEGYYIYMEKDTDHRKSSTAIKLEQTDKTKEYAKVPDGWSLYIDIRKTK